MPLTVITHSLDNCIALSEHNKVTVKVLSGTLNHENRYFYSNLAVEELADVVFDTAFIAASGIDETGAYLLDQGDAQIVGTAVKRARKVILVAEHQNSSTSLIIEFVRWIKFRCLSRTSSRQKSSLRCFRLIRRLKLQNKSLMMNIIHIQWIFLF